MDGFVGYLPFIVGVGWSCAGDWGAGMDTQAASQAQQVLELLYGYAYEPSTYARHPIAAFQIPRPPVRS
eukprot:6874724-Prymnesium_polylepis.1